MSETIDVEVGNLYADLHEQFEEDVDDQYTARLRQHVEEFLHQFNQMYERQLEQAGVDSLDELPEDALEAEPTE